MAASYLTIKELTDAVGSDITPRMVRHYHKLGLLAQPVRSHSKSSLGHTARCATVAANRGAETAKFQLYHIQQLLETDTNTEVEIITGLQQKYQSIMQQLARLRQTAAALEGLLGYDRSYQNLQKSDRFSATIRSKPNPD